MCLPCHCKYLHVKHFKSLAISTSSRTLIQSGGLGMLIMSAVLHQEKIKSGNFKRIITSINSHIKLTIELPGTGGLPFLDTLTKPTPNSIESTVYRKPTHTDRYLDYNFNQPISAKLSVIHTVIHTAKQVCSTPELLAKEMDHLHKVLQDNHYQHHSFNKVNPNRKPTKSQTHPQESL